LAGTFLIDRDDGLRNAPAARLLNLRYANRVATNCPRRITTRSRRQMLSAMTYSLGVIDD
jgi:hypothetical protein